MIREGEDWQKVIIEKAEKEKYEYKDFNDYDLEKISREIKEYYEAVTTYFQE